MANWYDSIVDSISTVPDMAGDLIGEYFSAESDRIGEEIREPVTNEQIKQPATAAHRVAASQPFNWQMAGVIVGGVGLALTAYKLIK